jgi:hypothetical protein
MDKQLLLISVNLKEFDLTLNQDIANINIRIEIVIERPMIEMTNAIVNISSGT